MSKVGLWSTSAGNNNATPPDGWPEGQAPSTVNDCAREMMAAVRTMAQDMAWFDHGFSPTYISGTTFSIPGDQTAFIEAGRQVKLYDGTSSGPIYRQVGSVSYTTVTTISLGAGTAITNSLSSFAISILSNVNPAIPGYIQVLIDAVSAAAANAASAASVNILPAGTIIYAGMSTAPTGFLECNGTAVSRTTYANLFSAVGTTWGAGNGSSTFALPDLRGEFLRVWDNGRGVDTSRTFASAQSDLFASHNHSQQANTLIQGATALSTATPDFGISTGGTTGAAGGAETRPRNIAVLACIKT